MPSSSSSSSVVVKVVENANAPARRRALARSAAETRRRREEFSKNAERWAREEKERVKRRARERKEEIEKKTERFLPGRRRRRRIKRTREEAVGVGGRKSAYGEVGFVDDDEEVNEEEEEEEEEFLVFPRHSEPNVRYAKEEEQEEKTENRRNSESISWWCSFTLDATEREKRVKAIEKLRERRRGISSSVKAQKKKIEKKMEHVSVQKEEEEEQEESPIASAFSPRQNLKTKRFRRKQEVSESKDFAGQEAKLLASIARLDEVVKRNEIHSIFGKQIKAREKEEETRSSPEEHALMRSIARLNLKLELTNETIQIHDEKIFRELLQI